jgi:dTDP-4-dehydrorhamnose 3,5-epimerase
MPGSEAGLRYDDPELDIRWPITVGEVSERDCNFSFIDKSFTGVII